VTLAAVVAPLAVYAVLFQTALYVSLPSRLRTRVAPWVTGAVGAGVTLAAGAIFGFHTIGLVGGDPWTALAWGVVATVVVAVFGVLMLRREDGPELLADPRLGELSDREYAVQVLVRIPVFTALIEEAFFRGVLHAALAALYPIQVAVWLGAGLFGLWHIGPGLDQARAGRKDTPAGVLHTLGTIVATSVAGLFLVWLRLETGSIWASVAVHAAMNMTMAVFARFATRKSWRTTHSSVTAEGEVLVDSGPVDRRPA
jgi:membrane protease YdiL (CAAX protease family)